MHVYLVSVFLYSVRITSDDARTFRGYQVRALQVGGDVERVLGNFLEAPADTKLQSWYPDVLTHRVSGHATSQEFTHWVSQQSRSLLAKYVRFATL